MSFRVRTSVLALLLALAGCAGGVPVKPAGKPSGPVGAVHGRVVGKDATPMRGRPDGNGVSTDTSYETSTVSFGAGESIDAIFVAPPFSGGSGSSGQGYDVYALYDRAYERAGRLGDG